MRSSKCNLILCNDRGSNINALSPIRVSLVAPHVAQAQPHSGHVIMWAKDVHFMVGTATAAAATMENLVENHGVKVSASAQPRERLRRHRAMHRAMHRVMHRAIYLPHLYRGAGDQSNARPASKFRLSGMVNFILQLLRSTSPVRSQSIR